jgi:hypothetical protein
MRVGGILSLLPTLVYQPMVNAALIAGPMSQVRAISNRQPGEK